MKLLPERHGLEDVPPPEAEVLIEEARRRQRRRWRISGLVAVLVVGGTAIGYGVADGGPPPSARNRGSTRAANVAFPLGVKTLNLSKSDKYGDLALVGNRIFLYGPAVEEEDPSTSATCNSAVVNPTTLALSDFKSSSCADPALQGQRVLPVVTVEPTVPFEERGGVATVTVRISHVVDGQPGYALGPVVMSFPQESDGWPGWAYGDGNLWLFDGLAKGGSQLLRISATTGAVEQRFAMPAVSRPIIAVDSDGFWMAPAANSGYTASDDGVYHVSPGAKTATRALTIPDTIRGDQYVRWMAASGHSLWFYPGPMGSTVYGVTGPSALIVSRVRLASSIAGVLFGPDGVLEGQDNDRAIVGDTSGLWTTVVIPPTAQHLGTRQQIFRLVPSTGRVNSVALLQPGYSSANQLIDSVAVPEAITYRGSMYLLDPPAPIGPNYKGEGFSAIYRITADPA